MNRNVLIRHLMNLIFSNQNLHCESSDLLTGQQDSESDQNITNCSKLVCVFFVCACFVYLIYFSDKNYEPANVVLSYTLS